MVPEDRRARDVCGVVSRRDYSSAGMASGQPVFKSPKQGHRIHPMPPIADDGSRPHNEAHPGIFEAKMRLAKDRMRHGHGPIVAPFRSLNLSLALATADC